MGPTNGNRRTQAPEFPVAKFELLVRSFLDNLIEWEVMHNFAIAHFDDPYAPEFQRPVEDLHMMFLPPVVPDHEMHTTRPQMRYLLEVLEMLRQDIDQLGLPAVRNRELHRMQEEAPDKVNLRREVRERYRPKG